MSDVSALPDVPLRRPKPHGAGQWLETCIRIGWRPAGCWVAVGVLAVNGIAIPLVTAITKQSIPTMDWHGMVIFAGLFSVHAGFRCLEKIQGAAE